MCILETKTKPKTKLSLNRINNYEENKLWYENVKQEKKINVRMNRSRKKSDRAINSQRQVHQEKTITGIPCVDIDINIRVVFSPLSNKNVAFQQFFCIVCRLESFEFSNFVQGTEFPTRINIQFEINEKKLVANYTSTHIVLEARLVSSCLSWPSSARPRLSLLSASIGLRKNTLLKVNPGATPILPVELFYFFLVFFLLSWKIIPLQ